jgi:hypothetical protein
MEIIFETLFQFFAEMLLQAVFELLTEFGYRSLAKRLRRPRNPIYSIIGFIIFGAIAGGVSLLILPYSPIEDPTFRKINLIAMPILLGLLMMLVAKLRQKKGQDLVRIDRFGYAFVFALAMGLVRFIWAE